MILFRIQNRITKKWWEGEAESAQEACQLAGWLIGDCWIREATQTRYRGWKNVKEAEASR